ncbi:TetR/AcrR family transcriptional regulator [Nocardiopsis lambiniae]|uniref:TetR family transcriptional regulator n=1 Tax=Nocardiopsis lambiniae TaxID=3075539 RepID=A0ABU2MBV9_9ACTN|nr:TetR family transcriptional regulator [Nocardiopsis sp. DSM 44743]MDT0330167.1 TetR family transcriptional regulator [Nocardiopsis sp. DSM 44743]
MTGGVVNRGDGRCSRGIRRRAALLSAALRVAERSGIAAVGLRSVAREGGTTPSLVGYHFPDRAVLLESLSYYTAARFEARASEVAAGSADRLEVLAAVIADTSGPSRSRALVEYELALLAARGTDPPETDLGWPRLLARAVRRTTEDPLVASRVTDEIEGLRFRAATGPDRLRAHEVLERIEQILAPRRAS